MFALTVIGILVLIIAIIIYFEYKNEKEYQGSKRKGTEEHEQTKPSYDTKEKAQKPLEEKKEKAAKRKTSTPGTKEESLPPVKKTVNDTYKLKDESKYVVKPRKVPSAKELRESEQKKLEQQKIEKQKIEKQKLEQQKPESKVVPEPEAAEKVNLPQCKYPKFDYSRLIKMGLGEDEAVEFIKELIPQIKTQIPLISEAIEASDFNNVERLTHSIKGSSTTVGSGGVSDLLVEFNTYVKTEKEIPVLKAYLKHLTHYCKELEKEYA